MHLHRWWSLIVAPAIAIGLLIGLVLLLMPAVPRVGLSPGHPAHMRNAMQHLSLAILHYADGHDHTLLPPAIYAKDGKPLLSWRVLLLPYLEHESLYRKFHLDEPWDSPHNLALLPKMPNLYGPIPDTRPKPPYATSYRVFVGPGAAFEGRIGVSNKQFKDGLDRTILIVDAAEAVPWTKPAELPYAAEGALPKLGHRFPDKFCVAFADGDVKWAPRNVTESALRAAITRDGREPWDPLVP